MWPEHGEGRENGITCGRRGKKVMEGVIDLGKELGISGSMQENMTAVTIRGCLADRADHSYCFVRVASPSESC